MASDSVIVRREPMVFPTYEPLPPDKNPMFLEKRVYQGSSGKVYPLPFFNRIAEKPVDRAWDAVIIENRYIKAVVLPELGGRIHIGEDKTNGYDFFYRQNVIKPALVGLGGPWASGGVEFNWPQHHRPATFMRVEVEIEEHSDGSRTVWLSDHDPMERMKGMHGVCLHPDRAVIELKMRAYNRTPYVQSFLWWANVATHAHEGYQSFFPPDVTAVADHAKRAMSRFPFCADRYYGVDYGKRGKKGIPADEVPSKFIPPHALPEDKRPPIPNYRPDDLSWYANIPVPTSYMCLGSKGDFSGGYDHFKHAGLVQIADHHIAPGKKQWTWGNHDFGFAWDRNLTDAGGPYVELMIGVYTDNQPDFSFLQPGETKAWSVYWYPIQKIGPAQSANLDAAVSLQKIGNEVTVGVASTAAISAAEIELTAKAKRVGVWTVPLAPDCAFVERVKVTGNYKETDLRLTVRDESGRELVAYSPRIREEGEMPKPASEPPLPADVKSSDELYEVGRHLAQYRHATRHAVDYWREALRRDPGDGRCNNAVGIWHLKRGEFSLAEASFRLAIARITALNPNPENGEAFYHLGLSLCAQEHYDAAYDAFYKATWNQAWQSAGYHALAEIDVRRENWSRALDHLDRSLRLNTDHLRARNLRVIVLRRLGREDAARAFLSATLALDPLDAWARHLQGGNFTGDTQTRLDVALDYARAGLYPQSISLLESANPESDSGVGPIVGYALAYFYDKIGERKKAGAAAARARKASPDYCFPSRLEEIAILEAAIKRDPCDPRAPFYLGNLFYDRRRYDEAIALWTKSAELYPSFSIVWRNLGIAWFNVRNDVRRARAAYACALDADPSDARLLYERDQLLKRCGESPTLRLQRMEEHLALVAQRDDATIELCALYNQVGQPQKAAELLSGRRFQPWEGGEGLALGQHVRTCLALGRLELREGEMEAALAHFESALRPPENLGEARHLLANASDVHYWLGEALASLGRNKEARAAWQRAADFRGDFQEMSIRPYSEMTYYSACGLARLGRKASAQKLLNALGEYADQLAKAEAKIDYFATSLPTMLLFNDDLTERQRTTALWLKAQSEFGLGKKASARKRLRQVLKRDPSHAAAADFFRDF